MSGKRKIYFLYKDISLERERERDVSVCVVVWGERGSSYGEKTVGREREREREEDRYMSGKRKIYFLYKDISLERERERYVSVCVVVWRERGSSYGERGARRMERRQ